MTGALGTERAVDGLVIVGGGVAALRTAQSVRSEGYMGPITMVCAESHLPYDRPPLSKQVLQGDLEVDGTDYHSAEYFADVLDVAVVLGRHGSGVDLAQRRVRLSDGEVLAYDALVVATGSRPRRLPFALPAEGVHVLRTKEDAVGLRADLTRSNRLAVVGAGFVGAEVASTAVAMGVDVVVVETAPVPLMRAVGSTVGRSLGALHETAGVKLVCGTAVTGFAGRDHVEGLTLDDGSIVDVDLVLAGVGVVPDIEWLEGSGLAVSDGLACDDKLCSSDPRVFGAGDAISYPSARLGRRTRSQQWTTASEQGRYLGRVLVQGPDHVAPFDSDLYFWSDQYGVRVQGAGIPEDDCVVLIDDIDQRRYLAAFRSGDRIRGVASVNHPKEFAALRKLIRRGSPWADVEAFLTTTPSRLVSAHD
ncbi:FAD-dependent oxidoreductase [Alloalcanivorax gelatiniphagus]